MDAGFGVDSVEQVGDRHDARRTWRTEGLNIGAGDHGETDQARTAAGPIGYPTNWWPQR